MHTPASDNPSESHASATPTISAQGHLLTGSGFLPDRNVAIRITAAGEDISDYLTYITDWHSCLHCELSNGATGPDPEGACGRLWSNTNTLVVADA